MRLFQVGGSIRDELLSRQSHDIDFAVEAESYDAMRDTLLANGYTIWQERPEFASIRAQFPNRGPSCDFTLCRRDGFYSDGRRPDSVEPGSLHDDLSRRDFTVNAIAREATLTGLSYASALIDPFGGVPDIRSKLIRTVGDPAERLEEDSLRALRALRFHVTLGFDIADDLRYVMRTERVTTALGNVSAERMWEESSKMFRADLRRTLAAWREFPNLMDAVFYNDRGIWLKPTMEQK